MKRNNGALRPNQFYQFDAIIRNYILGVESQVAERLHYSASLHVVEKAIDAIIDCIIDNDRTVLSYEDAYMALDTVCTRYHVNSAC